MLACYDMVSFLPILFVNGLWNTSQMRIWNYVPVMFIFIFLKFASLINIEVFITDYDSLMVVLSLWWQPL